MKQLTRFSLYAVTDRKEGTDFMDLIERALRGGVTALQLREKHLERDAYLSEAVAVKKLCKTYGVPLFLNDDPEVASLCGADGVHVGAEDLPVSVIKRRYPHLLVGATAKSLAQALDAEEAGADYLGVGAVFPSPTKPNALPVTRELLATIAESVKIPVVAIGGITAENLSELSNTGISGVAVCSSLFSAADVEGEAKKFIKILEEMP